VCFREQTFNISTIGAFFAFVYNFIHQLTYFGRCAKPVGETPQELATRRLTARPAESEVPETEINRPI
ncbi:hypothetical protein SM124_16150, partial [Bacillus sp. 31A1R]|nr:hypothetical protein [Bacillus sp. 31A1R]